MHKEYQQLVNGVAHKKRSTTMEHNRSPITKVSIAKLQNEN
jgi:hypothetical protein